MVSRLEDMPGLIRQGILMSGVDPMSLMQCSKACLTFSSNVKQLHVSSKLVSIHPRVSSRFATADVRLGSCYPDIEVAAFLQRFVSLERLSIREPVVQWFRHAHYAPRISLKPAAILNPTLTSLDVHGAPCTSPRFAKHLRLARHISDLGLLTCLVHLEFHRCCLGGKRFTNMINSLAVLKELIIMDCEVSLWGANNATELACLQLETLHMGSTNVITLILRCPLLSVLEVHDLDCLDIMNCDALRYLDTNVECVKGGESVTHLICRHLAMSENHVSGKFPNVVDLSMMHCCNFQDEDGSPSVITLHDLPSLKNLIVNDFCMSHYVITQCPVLKSINVTHPHVAMTATVLHNPDSHHIVWTPDEV